MARTLGTNGRFFLAYLILGAAVGAGIGTFIVLLQRPGPKPGPPWSAWKPGASSTDAQAAEIAAHVGPRYRLPSGDQLAKIKVGGPARSQSLRAIAIPTKSQPKTVADFQRYDESQSVIYLLCGAGKNCKINEGKASQARGTVLRREALELALYTFKYSHPIDNVLVFFPPGPRQKRPTFTLFFHRDELGSPLKRPLRFTLPARNPPLPGEIASVEKQNVDQLTGRKLYRFAGLVNAPGYGRLVVLEPAA